MRRLDLQTYCLQSGFPAMLTVNQLLLIPLLGKTFKKVGFTCLTRIKIDIFMHKYPKVDLDSTLIRMIVRR